MSTRRLALVTGASSGLGRALALELASPGHGARAPGRDVVVLARDRERLEETARAVEAKGVRALRVEADVRDERALASALAPALAEGALDRVAHAAGVLALGSIDALSSDDFRRCLDVNVLGSAHVARATLPHLERTRGRLAFVASIAGVLSLPGGFTAYSASKWGVRGLAQVLRPEAAARGVHVMAAFPSILATPMVAPLGDAKDAPSVYRVFPWHPPEEAAARIVADLERGRRESYMSLGERLGAWCSDAFPSITTSVLHAIIEARDPDRRKP